LPWAPTLCDMDALAHYLLTQAYNNAWANHRLFAACAQLDQAEFEAPRTGFFPSIRSTMNHLLTVDWYYIDSMQRSISHSPVNTDFLAFFEPEEPFATCNALQTEQSASDACLIDLCKSLDARALDREISVPRRRGVVREPLVRLLAHLFEHQVHHRGQVHAMLSGTRIAPPQLDEFFCVGDAPLRTADFQALRSGPPRNSELPTNVHDPWTPLPPFVSSCSRPSHV
jgi:uncharacterized damage-inducible protein DinB